MSNALRFFTPRRLTLLGALAVAGTLVACSPDSTVGPTNDPVPQSMQAPRSGWLSSGIGGLLGTVNTITGSLIDKVALKWTTPLAAPITRSFHVTNAGGTFEFPETGLKLIVPANALPGSSLTITATALAGAGVAYSFEPHGTVFRKKLVFSQSLAPTTHSYSLFSLGLGGGYFANDSQVNSLTGVVRVNELLPATVLSNRVRFNIDHFSGYMVSMD